MKQFLKNRMLAFAPAISGVSQAVRQEAALKIHLAASAVVLIIVTSGYFSSQKNLLLVLACFGVIIAELINTSVEKLCDLYTKELNVDIKFIKDVSAAAVLLSVVAAILVAVFVVFG